jgi:type VI secretion system secreted protein VgrG
MLKVRAAQMTTFGDQAPNNPVVTVCDNDPHFIEFQLFDKNGDPVPGEPFRVRLPDKSLRTGTLDNEGKVRFERICGGNATICFTGMDENEWKPL